MAHIADLSIDNVVSIQYDDYEGQIESGPYVCKRMTIETKSGQSLQLKLFSDELVKVVNLADVQAREQLISADNARRGVR